MTLTSGQAIVQTILLYGSETWGISWTKDFTFKLNIGWPRSTSPSTDLAMCGFSKVEGCFEGVRDEDDGGVYRYSMLDNRYVHWDPSDPR